MLYHYGTIFKNSGGFIMSISEQKRQEAIEFFKKIGLFITFVDPDDPNVSEEEKEKSVELYHGRIRTANEQPGTWFVDPEYRMAGGAKAGRRDLSTTRSIGFAEGFADKMVAINDAKGIEVTPEIYKIVPTVENSISLCVSPSLSLSPAPRFFTHSPLSVNLRKEGRKLTLKVVEDASEEINALYDDIEDYIRQLEMNTFSESVEDVYKKHELERFHRHIDLERNTLMKEFEKYISLIESNSDEFSLQL